MFKAMAIWERISCKYSKKLMDIATITGIDAAKTASKRVVQKKQQGLQEI